MAAKTSSGAAVVSGVSCTGGSYASPPVNCQSASQDLTASLGALWTLRGVPVATLTTGCSWQVDVSWDATAWRQLVAGVFGLTSGVAYDVAVDLPFPTMYTRITFWGSSSSCTVSAELSRATGIS